MENENIIVKLTYSKARLPARTERKRTTLKEKRVKIYCQPKFRQMQKFRVDN